MFDVFLGNISQRYTDRQAIALMFYIGISCFIGMEVATWFELSSSMSLLIWLVIPSSLLVIEFLIEYFIKKSKAERFLIRANMKIWNAIIFLSFPLFALIGLVIGIFTLFISHNRDFAVSALIYLGYFAGGATGKFLRMKKLTSPLE